MKSPLILFVALLSLTAQGYSSPAPKELKLFVDVSIDDDARLFPLGWSKDGKIAAMLIAHSEQAASERQWELHLLDLETSRETHSSIHHVDARLGVEAAWKKIGEKVDAVCAKYGIVRGEGKLHSFPLFSGPHRPAEGPGRYETIEADLNIERGTDTDLGSRGIRKMQTLVSVDGDTTKIVGVEEWENWIPLAAGIVGAIPNPNGDGVVVVVAVVCQGFEGPPHRRQLLLYGASLD